MMTDEHIAETALRHGRPARHLRRRIETADGERVYFAGQWMRLDQARRVLALMDVPTEGSDDQAVDEAQ